MLCSTFDATSCRSMRTSRLTSPGNSRQSWIKKFSMNWTVTCLVHTRKVGVRRHVMFFPTTFEQKKEKVMIDVLDTVRAIQTWVCQSLPRRSWQWLVVRGRRVKKNLLSLKHWHSKRHVLSFGSGRYFFASVVNENGQGIFNTSQSGWPGLRLVTFNTCAHCSSDFQARRGWTRTGRTSTITRTPTSGTRWSRFTRRFRGSESHRSRSLSSRRPVSSHHVISYKRTCTTTRIAFRCDIGQGYVRGLLKMEPVEPRRAEKSCLLKVALWSPHRIH